MPNNWSAIRAKVLRRDGRICQSCGDAATEVDHVEAGDDHDLSNLQALCTPCHRAKSAREGNAVMQATRRSSYE